MTPPAQGRYYYRSSLIYPIYEIFDHSADLGLRIYAETIDDLFINAGRALSQLIAPTLKRADEDFLFLSICGADTVDLLINWLRELLYLFNGEARLVNSIVIVSLENLTVNARIGVVSFDDMIEIGYEIKAVTYHQARIVLVEKGYAATVIFDL